MNPFDNSMSISCIETCESSMSIAQIFKDATDVIL